MTWITKGPEPVPGLREACDLVARAALERADVDDLAAALFLYASKVADMAEARVREVLESQDPRWGAAFDEAWEDRK